MQLHLHEVTILQIHNAMPEFVEKISRLLTNQNPTFLYKVELITYCCIEYTTNERNSNTTFSDDRRWLYR